MNPTNLPKTLTIFDVARLIHKPTGYVRKLVKKNLIPHARTPDGDFFFFEEDVAEWVRSLRAPVPSSAAAEAVSGAC